MVFEKVKCLANTYKSVDLNCKLLKITNYIYIREFISYF